MTPFASLFRKRLSALLHATSGVLALTIFLVSSAAATNTASTPQAKTAAVAENKPIRSVFLIPTTPKEGRDPFHPKSDHVFQSAAPAVKPGVTNTPTVAVELSIGGVSGTAEKPFVIINNVTFGVNDESDVIVNKRRIKVRCTEINVADSYVRVQVGNETRTLRLPKRD